MRLLFYFFLFVFPTISFSQSWKPVNGSIDNRDHYTAFTNATIFVKEGKILSNATLLIKDNKIVSLSQSANQLPANTLVVDLKGKFIYPSFIDLSTQYGIDAAKENKNASNKPQLESNKMGPYYWNEAIKPENKAIELFHYKEDQAKKLREMGFGTVLTHQSDGIIRGTSVLVTLTDEKTHQVILPEAAMQYAFSKGMSKQTYPTSLMGIIALIRQVHYDAQWYASNEENLEYNKSLEALNQNRERIKIIDVYSPLSIFMADKIGDEFGFQFIIKGQGREYERLEELKATQAPLIIPINFPKAYDVSDPYDALNLSLAKMKEWEMASQNLNLLSQNEIGFAITSEGLKASKEFYTNIQLSINNGLSRSKAIESLTEYPAKLIGQEEMIGSLEAGKLANFIVTSDSLFTDECQLLSNWIQGKEFVIKSESKIKYEGNYSLNINKSLQFELKLTKRNNKLIASIKGKEQTSFQEVKLVTENNRVNLSFSFEGTNYRLSGAINDSLSRIWSGKTIVNGEWVEWAAIKMSSSQMAAMEDDEVESDSIVQVYKIQFPNTAYGWDSLPTEAPSVIFRNATLWTNESDGILKNYDLVISEGKIKMLGYKINLDVMFPELKDNIVEIDATGKHITSGIIDEHSHIGIERGVNEAGQAITSEVSIADVINSSDINIYRQLAGGVTASQLLHGSANPIGGQSGIIKLRWGYTPEQMKIEGADGFIKFALGENVKQSNWGDNKKIRFPQTRMGVEQVYYDAFYRAKAYQASWKIYNAKKNRDKQKSTSPRVDLELEALAEILDSTRFITCHSYLQSEMNMLLHVADSMKFHVNTFTHVLEGYKIADKLKTHGTAASTFSDWWAYKFEVNDAIPYNGAILHEHEVLTAFNSDDAEMGRRLNQEAAKAVKYGGLSEEEAWKFVTLNPAKMLHLDDRMGSLKVGKDADIVVWTDNPLSIYTRTEQVYIDGILFFDKEKDRAMRKAILMERERIINLMLQEKAAGKATQEVKEEQEMLYDCETIEF